MGVILITLCGIPDNSLAPDMNTIVTTFSLLIMISSHSSLILASTQTHHHQDASCTPTFPPPTSNKQCLCKHFTQNMQSVVVKDNLGNLGNKMFTYIVLYIL